MKNKGFTLIEVLGIIVILSLLLILIVPGIINRLSSKQEQTIETQNKIIYDAAYQYINERPDKFPIKRSSTYCIGIKTLIDDGKLSSPVIDVNTGKNISDKYILIDVNNLENSEIKDNSNCK